MPEGEGKSESETFGALVGYTISMKLLLLFVSLLLPSAALATPVDSTRGGPFKLPFDLNITVHCSFDSFYYRDQLPPRGSDSSRCSVFGRFGASIRVDTGSIFYNSDTITGGNSDTTYPYMSTYFTLVFDTNKHTIVKLSIDYQTGGNGPTDWSITLRDLRYDSSGIFTQDSILADHLDSAYYSAFTPLPVQNGISYTTKTLRSVSSIDFSGLFRSTHLANTSSVGESAEVPNLTVHSLRGFLEYTFATSTYSRPLDVYSPLGVKVASYPIAPGQTTADIPKLPSGLYFIRLEGALLKVYVPE